MTFSTQSHSNYPLVEPLVESLYSGSDQGSSTVDVNEEREDMDGASDNLSLGSFDTDISPATHLPPTYDMAAILSNVRQPVSNPNHTNTATNIPNITGSGAGHPHHHQHEQYQQHEQQAQQQAQQQQQQPHRGSSGKDTAGGRLTGGLGNLLNNGLFRGNTATSQEQSTNVLPTNRIPVNTPSTAEMENLPTDVVALILETLTIVEIFDIHTLSDRWRQLTTRALLDKFRLTHVVLWIDQEGHRAFRPQFVFDSFDEATNRIRWRPLHTAKPESRGQVYNKTFGISKPIVRIISVGDIDKFDYLDKEAQISISKPGTRTILGTDKGCPWAMVYKVSSFTRKGKKIDGERWIEPLAFECHLDFLNPRRAHKLRLLWYLQKSYSAIPVVGHADSRQAARTKIEGVATDTQMKNFINSLDPIDSAHPPSPTRTQAQAQAPAPAQTQTQSQTQTLVPEQTQTQTQTHS